MIIGALRLHLTIRWARSLKDRRRALRSLKDRLRNEFNAAVAEVGYQDRIKESLFGVAVVGSDQRLLNSVLDAIVSYVRRDSEVELVDYEMEWY